MEAYDVAESQISYDAEAIGVAVPLFDQNLEDKFVKLGFGEFLTRLRYFGHDEINYQGCVNLELNEFASLKLMESLTFCILPYFSCLKIT